MKTITTKKNELIEAIINGKVFQRYEEARKAIIEFPEKKAQADRFREESYRMAQDHQEDPEAVRLLLEKRFDMRSDKLITEYLDAELDYCRMIQRLCMEILNVADLELTPFADTIRD